MSENLRCISDPVNTAIQVDDRNITENAPLRRYAGNKADVESHTTAFALSAPGVTAEAARQGGDHAALAAHLVEEIDFLAGE